MRNDYPKDYKGPKAGLSDNQEWLEVTEFQAFKHMRFKDWTYADFDCWLGARDDWNYNRGCDDVKKELTEFQKMYNIKAEVKSWYEKSNEQ